MDSNVANTLKDVFTHSAHATEGMDGLQFAKLSKELVSELVKRYEVKSIDATSVDLIFAKVKTRGQRRIDFNQFVLGIETIGRKMSVSADQVLETVCSIYSTKMVMLSLSENRTVSGPARFYYDKRTYTGTQSERQSSASNSGKAVDLSEIVNREKREKEEYGAHRRLRPMQFSPAIVKSRDQSPSLRSRRLPPRLHAGKENFVISSPGAAVGLRATTPPASGGFYDRVVSDRFLNPVDGYFENFLSSKDDLANVADNNS